MAKKKTTKKKPVKKAVKKYLRSRKDLLGDIKFEQSYGNAKDCETDLLEEELKDIKLILKLTMDFVMKYTHQCPNPQKHSEDCPDSKEEIETGERHG